MKASRVYTGTTCSCMHYVLSFVEEYTKSKLQNCFSFLLQTKEKKKHFLSPGPVSQILNFWLFPSCSLLSSRASVIWKDSAKRETVVMFVCMSGISLTYMQKYQNIISRTFFSFFFPVAYLVALMHFSLYCFLFTLAVSELSRN